MLRGCGTFSISGVDLRSRSCDTGKPFPRLALRPAPRPAIGLVACSNSIASSTAMRSPVAASSRSRSVFRSSVTSSARSRARLIFDVQRLLSGQVGVVRFHRRDDGIDGAALEGVDGGRPGCAARRCSRDGGRGRGRRRRAQRGTRGRGRALVSARGHAPTRGRRRTRERPHPPRAETPWNPPSTTETGSWPTRAASPPAPARWPSPGTAAGSWSSAPNILPRTGPVPGGPVSADPACEPCTCLADEARIAGTVIRALGRV